MNSMIVTWFGITLAASLAACSSGPDVDALRETLDRSTVSLSQTVTVAEAETDEGAAVKAALILDDAVFSVDALAGTALTNVRVDLDGKVLSMSALGEQVSAACPGSIALVDAIAIAEAEAGGEAVAIEPDDDESCASEVQVLSSDTLWEVKVAGDGAVLEKEESDEYSDDDDDEDDDDDDGEDDD